MHYAGIAVAKVIMYLDFWNLKEHPFQNVDDTRFAYLSDQHHEGLARLVYLVENRKLGGVLTGPYGVGKTMVIELLAQQLRKSGNTRFARIDYHPGSTASLARYILSSIGYKDEQELGRISEAMDAIRMLRRDQRRLSHTTLVVDEAQAITDPEVYHLLHLLLNISLLDEQDRPTGVAFTIILAGYSDMTKLLSTDDSLCQRLQMLWQLEPLNSKQVLEYVQHRIRVAGGDMWIFDMEAIEDLAKEAKGIPRQINNICDIALMLGFAANVNKIDRGLMAQAIQDACYPFVARKKADEAGESA
jgi:general secretion pathway protein A